MLEPVEVRARQVQSTTDVNRVQPTTFAPAPHCDIRNAGLDPPLSQGDQLAAFGLGCGFLRLQLTNAYHEYRYV